MTESPTETPKESPTEAAERDGDEKDGGAVRELLKRSLAENALTSRTPDLLAGVQRRIRNRSRGKFFADGWSTTQARTSYVLVGLITLLMVALACYALAPLYVR